MTTRDAWGKKATFSGEQDNCVFVKRTLDAVRDTKNPAVVLPVDMRTLVQLVQADRFDLPTS